MGFFGGKLRTQLRQHIVANHVPPAKGFIIAGYTVDNYPNIGTLVKALFGCHCQRLFDRFKNNFLVYALFIGDRFSNHQNFFAH